ncbi:type II toxin-antitoxin system death-on-curing family toxin [Gracilibacillus thailandensis]|uniref:Type II toxin-antitoxin system death-on-curing family toxin n=1 Tax=Gracilibacillus thailandensis TaxID=563735 RepID=A0A6N7R314_9BACI|nr:type II toxin-antitoxin system death-on-curing family toxin [Gracilibacillus thailandensis]MRI66186.1 type II toxin-antitoxin system death-on-curing family toxin [Gracilibacillus thailandensis]
MVRYLTEKEVIFINSIVIQKYTPGEQQGVKDVGLLQSALHRPKQTVFGQDAYPTIFDKAAALFASLTQNHSFHNANKRTGFSAMKQFLWLNGYNLIANQREAVEFTVMVVKEKPEISEIAEWIEQNSVNR